MAKLKQLLLRACVLMLVLALCAPVLPVAAKPENVSPVRLDTIPDTYELLAQNDHFQLYANKTSLSFKVVDMRNGYVWDSNLDEKAETDRLNKTWVAFASSGISIDYLDQQAIGKRASVTNSPNSIDFKKIEGGFQAVIDFTDASIGLTLIVKLEPAGVSVNVPFASIRESGDFKLGTLYVYPFMGYTREDSIPGYMFIPDGAGTIIRFAAKTKANNMFYGKYYGTDLGMITNLTYDDTVNRPFNMSLPVFGMVHGVEQNAFICIVEKGASYGQIQAHPSGVITNFNFIFNAYTYNESYFQATNRSGDGVTVLQHNTNAFDILQHYRFLFAGDSDYVGLAHSYQDYLVEKGMLKKVQQPDSDISIKLEFLGGDYQKILFWKSFISMTTVRQVSDILKGLGVKNPEVVYYGWQPLGDSEMPPTSLKVEGALGSVEELKTLSGQVSAAGGKLYLYLDPQAAIEHSGGYSIRSDVAMSITTGNIWGVNRNLFINFLNLGNVTSRYTSLSRDVFTKLDAGLALDGIGWMLFSDFKKNHFINREDTIKAYQELLATNPGTTAFYTPNDYMFGFMQAYFDMPITDSNYIYTTETVPFLQVLLAGYVPFYGPALNFSSDLQADLLKQVDYDVYPSYYLTQEATARILDTSSNWIYTSSYAQWGAEVKQTYAWLDKLLGPVKGQEILARQDLAEGVSATTYSNGKMIIVNYNETPFAYGAITVNAQDAVITEVKP